MLINSAQTTVSRYLTDSELGEGAGRVHSDVTVRALGRLQLSAWECAKGPEVMPLFFHSQQKLQTPTKWASIPIRRTHGR